MLGHSERKKNLLGMYHVAPQSYSVQNRRFNTCGQEGESVGQLRQEPLCVVSVRGRVVDVFDLNAAAQMLRTSWQVGKKEQCELLLLRRNPNHPFPPPSIEGRSRRCLFFFFHQHPHLCLPAQVFAVDKMICSRDAQFIFARQRQKFLH